MRARPVARPAVIRLRKTSKKYPHEGVTPAPNFHLTFTGGLSNGSVRKSCTKKRQKRHAPPQERNVALGEGRKGRAREKPQTSDCHRSLGGQEERRQGPAIKIELAQASACRAAREAGAMLQFFVRFI